MGAPVEGKIESLSRNVSDRIVGALEIGAAASLAVATANIFVATGFRYLFNIGVPDTSDFGKLLLGIFVFWGIGIVSVRRGHIAVDLLWEALPRRGRVAVDIFADVVVAASLLTFCFMFAIKVIDGFKDNVVTYDLHVPLWIFFFIAWIGLAIGVLIFFLNVLGQLKRNTP